MDRKLLLLLAAAIPLGLAGGYAWSMASAPPQRAYVPPKPTVTDIAAAPEDYPAAVDDEWAMRGGNAPSVAEGPDRTATETETSPTASPASPSAPAERR